MASNGGGDIHVPHGHLPKATEIRRMTEAAGLKVAAYGSYYRVGHEETGPFELVLKTAIELGAPCIRVWAGRQGTDEADDAYWNEVVHDSRDIARQAQSQGLKVVYEFHSKTLTDSNKSTKRLLEHVNFANLKSYWQPPRHSRREYNLAGLEMILPWLHGLHIFSWDRTTGERLPLAAGADDWQHYLSKAMESKRNMFALLEFVKDDDPEQFLQDAKTLKRWMELTPEFSQQSVFLPPVD